jgi:hypothetical protein
VVMDRSKNEDFMIISVTELAHSIDFDMDRLTAQ